MTQASHPPVWLRSVERLSPLLKKLPLWGKAPSFHWEQAAEALCKVLGLSELKIHPGITRAAPAQELLRGCGARPYCLTLSLGPFSSPIHWVMPREDISLLIESCALAEPYPAAHQDPSFLEGLTHYFVLQALDTLNQSGLLWGYAGRIEQLQEMPSGGECMCLDLDIETGTGRSRAYLLCPEPFLQEWKRTFQSEPPSLAHCDLSTPLLVRWEVGSTVLSHEELLSARPGDFLILDRCTYDPSHHTGHAQAVCGDQTLFHTSWKPGKVQILDYALYEEVPMPPSPHTPSSEGGSDPIDDDLFDSELLSEEGSTGASSASPPESVTSLSTIPLTVTVEVARVEMSLEKLLSLQPGAVLELSVPVEQGVWLTINGTPVAQGELLRLGDLLGVRILTPPKP